MVDKAVLVNNYTPMHNANTSNDNIIRHDLWTVRFNFRQTLSGALPEKLSEALEDLAVSVSLHNQESTERPIAAHNVARWGVRGGSSQVSSRYLGSTQQLGADDLVVDGFEGFAFRFGRGARVDLGAWTVDVAEDVADVGSGTPASIECIARLCRRTCGLSRRAGERRVGCIGPGLVEVQAIPPRLSFARCSLKNTGR